MLHLRRPAPYSHPEIERTKPRARGFSGPGRALRWNLLLSRPPLLIASNGRRPAEAGDGGAARRSREEGRTADRLHGRHSDAERHPGQTASRGGVSLVLAFSDGSRLTVIPDDEPDDATPLADWACSRLTTRTWFAAGAGAGRIGVPTWRPRTTDAAPDVVQFHQPSGRRAGGWTMSEDIQGGAVPSRRKRPLGRRRLWLDPEYSLAPPFPGPLPAAGVIWIVFGCLVLLHLVVACSLTFVFAAALPARWLRACWPGTGAVLSTACSRRVPFRRSPERPRHGPRHPGQWGRVDPLRRDDRVLMPTVLFAGPNSVAAGIGALEAAILLAAGVLALAGGNQGPTVAKGAKNQRERKREERRERMEP